MGASFVAIVLMLVEWRFGQWKLEASSGKQKVFSTLLYRTPFKHTRQTRNNISARPIVYETKTSILSKFLHFVYIAFLHEGEIENVEFHISILILAFKNINIGNQSRIDISIILDFVHLAGSSWSTKVLFSKTKQKNKTKKLKGGQVTAAEPLRRKGVESREWTLQRANAYIPLDAHLRLPNHNPPTSTSFGSTSLQKPVCPVCCWQERERERERTNRRGASSSFS